MYQNGGDFTVKSERFFLSCAKYVVTLHKILKPTMNQQEIRSKYYLHSDVFHPETAGFFSFLQKRYFSSLVMR